ncbi:MAG TPA: LptF/LptG family permease, partial [Candidatus Binataceae bacterium]|nr:LptF/LptG family permease [Candidatus Binataceae bacterium]
RLEMTIPVLMVALVISMFDFALSETVVPLSTRQARYLYEVELKKRELKGVFDTQRIWVRVRNGFLSADRYDASDQTLRGITLYRIGGDYGLRDIVHARTAKWDGKAWVPNDAMTYQLRNKDSKEMIATSGNIPPSDRAELFGRSLKPADLSLLRLDPEEFSLWELNHYIQTLRRKGLDPGGYVVDRDLKYAMPLSCLIMVALGLALSLDPLPRSMSLGRSFGLAIAIGFGYWLAFGLTSSLGRSAIIPPMVAAWTPNLVFAALSLSIFLFGEER